MMKNAEGAEVRSGRYAAAVRNSGGTRERSAHWAIAGIFRRRISSKPPRSTTLSDAGSGTLTPTLKEYWRARSGLEKPLMLSPALVGPVKELLWSVRPKEAGLPVPPTPVNATN